MIFIKQVFFVVGFLFVIPLCGMHEAEKRDVYLHDTFTIKIGKGGHEESRQPLSTTYNYYLDEETEKIIKFIDDEYKVDRITREMYHSTEYLPGPGPKGGRIHEFIFKAKKVGTANIILRDTQRPQEITKTYQVTVN